MLPPTALLEVKGIATACASAFLFAARVAGITKAQRKEVDKEQTFIRFCGIADGQAMWVLAHEQHGLHCSVKT